MTAIAMESFDIAAVLARLGVAPAGITADSRMVRSGDAFAAYPGAHVDGRGFIADAITRGASVVFYEAAGFSWRRDWNVAHHGIDGLQHKLGEIADFIYRSPSSALWMVGVTGTNGKTTCAHAIAQCLDAPAARAAVIGTIGNGLVGAIASATHTTPDAATLHEMLAHFRAAGARAVAMEVSSHGLDQGRVNGVAFDVALFTNLSRDHLDYHGTMAAYGAAKARLFKWPGLKASVINCDDAFGQSLAESGKARGATVLTYGFGVADIAGSHLRTTANGTAFSVVTPWGPAEIETPLVGAFNAWNALGILGVLLASGMDLDRAVEALAHVQPPAGRMQRLGGGEEPLVVVDYAHTPDALEKALLALRPLVARGRELVCVFGCGGNRDPGKRPLMGRVAGELADRVIVTSDNPREEDPAAIAEAVLRGVRDSANRRWSLQVDRADAIDDAIHHAQAGDVVLVAGKGHEDYQERAGTRQHFSDAERIAAALRTWSDR